MAEGTRPDPNPRPPPTPAPRPNVNCDHVRAIAAEFTKLGGAYAEIAGFLLAVTGCAPKPGP